MHKDQFHHRLNEILKYPDPKEAFYKLSDLYRSVNESQREDIRQKWPFTRNWSLPDQNTLACQVPGERACEQRIRASLIYNSIDDCRSDWRETLVSLCQIYHSAIHAGVNTDEIFREVASLSSTKTAQIVIGFLERSEEYKSPEEFCLKAVTTKGGIRIEYGDGWLTEEQVDELLSENSDKQCYGKGNRPWWKFW
jgi:hypothetical protein